MIERQVKLLVLDKDGTLVRPKSGNTFVQHPEDQELIEGVAEAIQRYVADGWQLAIASNQGGCEVRWCHPAELPVGSYCNVDNIAIKVEYLQDTGEFILVNGHHPLPKTRFAKFQYKTLGIAIAEMQYAMKLIGIQYHGLFCPDMQGNECYMTSDFAAPPLHKVDRYKHLIGSFRKPSGGMLLALKQHFETHLDDVDRLLMIGDRSEDLGSAQAAGFDFVWAEDWRNNELDKVLPYRSEEWIALNS